MFFSEHSVVLSLWPDRHMQENY